MFKIQVEVNGIVFLAESEKVMNMGGLNAFIDSLTKQDQQGEWEVIPEATAKKMIMGWGKKTPATPAKRGRGRPAGAKNKRK